MQLANKTTNRFFKLKNKIFLTSAVTAILFSAKFITGAASLQAQDNSPFSRYGIGDLVPSVNITSRAMGGISAGYIDAYTINYSNPASLGSLEGYKELLTNRLDAGRMILDVGLNFDQRSLLEPGKVGKFKAYNAFFSHLQVAMPLRKNWGLSFGIRPYSKISYKISKTEDFKDADGNVLAQLGTLYEGSGGSYIAAAGLGKKINFGKKATLSLGGQLGYFFGEKDYNTVLSFIHDSISFKSSRYENRTNFGGLYTHLGLQFTTSIGKNMYLTLGGYGNTQQKYNANRDITNETVTYSSGQEDITRIDSVYAVNGQKGKITLPTSYTFGFALNKPFSAKSAGWLFGVDYTASKWSQYSYYDAADPAVQDNWVIKAGMQLKPASKKNYFSNVFYRAGLFTGQDYLAPASEKLPLTGITIGFGLPIANYNRFTPGVVSIINTSFEFVKRGNDDNQLKENLFRFSVGLSLSDLWFIKRKYD